MGEKLFIGVNLVFRVMLAIILALIVWKLKALMLLNSYLICTDSKLSWYNHVNNLKYSLMIGLQKIQSSKLCGVSVLFMQYMCPLEVMHSIYFAVIKSRTQYGIACLRKIFNRIFCGPLQLHFKATRLFKMCISNIIISLNCEVSLIHLCQNATLIIVLAITR